MNLVGRLASAAVGGRTNKAGLTLDKNHPRRLGLFLINQRNYNGGIGADRGASPSGVAFYIQTVDYEFTVIIWRRSAYVRITGQIAPIVRQNFSER
jgi:hypothetical protein